jgi:hypothetical protein
MGVINGRRGWRELMAGWVPYRTKRGYPNRRGGALPPLNGPPSTTSDPYAWSEFNLGAKRIAADPSLIYNKKEGGGPHCERRWPCGPLLPPRPRILRTTPHRQRDSRGRLLYVHRTVSWPIRYHGRGATLYVTRHFIVINISRVKTWISFYNSSDTRDGNNRIRERRASEWRTWRKEVKAWCRGGHSPGVGR